MATGTPLYPASIDSSNSLGPTSGIISDVTHLGDSGTNQGTQLGITNNLINTLIAVETVVGVPGSSIVASHDFKIATLNHVCGVFKAQDGNPPATNYAYFGTRNSGGLAVLQFAGAGVDTSTVFTGVFPGSATFTNGVQVIIWWASTIATSGAVEWQTAVNTTVSQSIDTDVYGTPASLISNTTAIAATVRATIINIPNPTIPLWAPGVPYKLQITRRASDTANDTMLDVASLWMVQVSTF